MLTLWFIILSHLGRGDTRPSHNIYAQSCCTYQKICTLLTLYAYRARAQLNRALAHLFQPSQGRLNEPHPSTARSDHTSQTNRALGVKRTRARLRLPSVRTPLFSRIPYTRVSMPTPALAHRVLFCAALCCVGSHDSAGLYSESACYNVMIEALDSEHNLFFYNKL